MKFEFSGKVWFWRGPAPWYFVTVPEPESGAIHSISKEVTYGWGVIPAKVCIGKTKWSTSLFPKDGAYLVPIKADVRRAEGLDEGDRVTLKLEIG